MPSAQGLGFGALRRPSLRPIEQRAKLLRRNESIRISQKLGDVVPVDDAVEPDADPPARADVGGDEEAVGRSSHHRGLFAWGRFDPGGVPASAVMVRGARVHGEDLVAHAERGLSPGLDLVGFGKSQ